MKIIYPLSCVVLAVNFLVAGGAHAEKRVEKRVEKKAEKKIRLDTGGGYVFVSSGGYEKGYVLDQSIAYENALVYRLGVAYINNLRPEDSRFSDDSELKTRALYFGVSKPIDLNRFKLEVGAGVMLSETEAHYFGRKVAEDKDTSPYLHLKLILDLGELVSLQADWKYVDDVSGGDLHLLETGVRFSF